MLITVTVGSVTFVNCNRFYYLTEREPRFAEYFQGHMKDIAAEFFTMLVFSYRDGMDGVERVIRNRLVNEMQYLE